MRHHELMSVNGGGWRCVVCGAVFPFETCLEEIMQSSCPTSHITGTFTIDRAALDRVWQSIQNRLRTPEQKGAEILRKAGYLPDE